MTVATLLYAWATSLFIGLVALGSETLLRSAGRQARAVWAIAGLVAVLLGIRPLVLGPAPVTEPPSVPTVSVGSGMLSTGSGMEDGPVSLDLAMPGVVAGTPRFFSVKLPFARETWWGMSGTLVLLSLGSMARLRRRMRGWRTDTVGGVPVLLSRDFGPAAVGLLRGRIVLPRWSLEAAGSEELRMAVAHEEEHLRGGDLPILAGFGLLMVAMPWNLPLWWYARRLTRAVEIDCDLRVLRRGYDLRAYGKLLIEMGGRRVSTPRLAPALGRRALLRDRIEQLVHPGAPGARRAWAAAAVIGGVVVACTVPAPTAPTTAGDPPAPSTVGPVIDASILDQAGLRTATAALARDPVVEDARGVIALSLQIDAGSGRVRHVRIDRTTGPAIGAGAIQATVTGVTTGLRLQPEQGHDPEGWVPLWILLAGDGVEAHLVRHGLYEEKGWPDDAASLGRHMDVYYMLRGKDVAGRDLSYAMAATARPGVQSEPVGARRVGLATAEWFVEGDLLRTGSHGEGE